MTMKKTLTLLLVTLLTIIATEARADATINESNFPDAAFREFLLEQGYGRDGVITNSEISAIKKMDVSVMGIANLKGIEYFTALTELDCSYNQLTTLDVSKNTKLTSLNCSVNSLTALDVWNNTALTRLLCSYNRISSIALQKNTELTYFDCSANQFKALNVMWNTKLNELHCYRNQIAEAQMDVLIASLPRNATNAVQKFYVKDWTDEGNVITLPQMITVSERGWTPYCYGESSWEPYTVIAIDATNFPDEMFRSELLDYSFGKDGYLTSEEIKAVDRIQITHSEIQSLKGIEYFTALTSLNLGKNDLLTALDLSKNTALERLECDQCGLKSIILPESTKLHFIDCSYNPLTKLDLSKVPALTELLCHHTQLSTLDLSKNTALTELLCHYTQLSTLDLSKNTALTELSCGGTPLSTLDLSKNTALTRLWCHDTQLSTLDVSKNTALRMLYCSYNQLTTLDLSKNTALTTLWCYQNQINGSNMDALIASLPLNTEDDLNWFCVINYASGEGNICTKTQVAAAKARGWQAGWTKDPYPSHPENPDGYYEGSDFGFVLGDVNGDGKVNSADVQKIYAIMARKDMGEGADYPEADVNNDSYINSADIQKIYAIMAAGK